MDSRHDGEPAQMHEDTLPARPARRRRRCAIPDCGKYARSGSPFCAAHRTESRRREVEESRRSAGSLLDSPTGSEATFDSSTTNDAASPPRRLSAAFRERLQSRDYRELFGKRLGELMEQAAAEEGVDDEIAVLRIVMARLMAEEDDPLKLAQAVARVAGVSIQAARLRRAISGRRAESLIDAVTQALLELEASSDGAVAKG